MRKTGLSRLFPPLQVPARDKKVTSYTQYATPMAERFDGRKNRPDPSALLSPDVVEQSPAIKAVKRQFESMLPGSFGPARTYISPTAALASAVRSDCQNNGCGVRAFVHINRVEGRWQMIENGPQFDRTGSACGSCKDLTSRK